jgi:hypothetical protein
MRFPWRKTAAAGKAAEGRAGWFGPPRLAERSCCCPARPVVMVLIPPASERWHPVDLLLCGHHYLSSKAALAVADAVVMDETGAIVDPAPVSNEICPHGSEPVDAPLPFSGGSLARSRPKRAQLRDRGVLTDSEFQQGPGSGLADLPATPGGMTPDWQSLRPKELRMG